MVPHVDVAAELLASLTDDSAPISDWHREVMKERLADLARTSTSKQRVMIGTERGA